jgi:hypothetical protein
MSGMYVLRRKQDRRNDLEIYGVFPRRFGDLIFDEEPYIRYWKQL